MHWITGVVALLLCMSMVCCNRCKSESDCSADECCAAMTPRNRNNARCKKLEKDKHPCNMPDKKTKEGMFMRACPCTGGYTCIPRKGFEEIALSEYGLFLRTCQKTPSSMMTSQNATEVDEEIIEEFVYEDDGVDVEKNKTQKA